jgi:hypothetical protein
VRGTVSPAEGERGCGAWGVELGAMRRLSWQAMCGAGRGGSTTLDGGAETGSTRLGMIAEERRQNCAPCHVQAYTIVLRSSIDLVLDDYHNHMD